MLSNLHFDTDQIREQDRHWIHPWENFKTAGTDPRTIIARSDGIYLTDTEGNRLIDGPAGMWCVNIGHGNSEMAEAIAEQVPRDEHLPTARPTGGRPAFGAYGRANAARRP